MEHRGSRMDNAPHLQNEDKPEFGKVLDEALRALAVVDGLRRTSRLNAEQLRTRTLRDAAAIAETAAPEYAYYIQLRAEVREAAAARSTPAPDPAEPPAGGDPFEGVGLIPVMAVLAPVLAGIASVVFLLLGYVLRGADGTLAIGRQLVTAGWVTLAVGAVAMVVGIVGILLTAARDGASPPDGESPERYAELATARDAWRHALRDRGVLPYLTERIAEARALDEAEGPLLGAGAPLGRGATGLLPELDEQHATLGFTSPSFTSPGVEGITDDHGHLEPEEESHFTSPGYSSPGYTSPDFTGPDEVPAPRRPAAPSPFPPRRPRRPPVPPRA